MQAAAATSPARPALVRKAASPQAFEAARRHSRRVHMLKRLLPLLAVVIALVFSAYSWLATPVQVNVAVDSAGIVDGKLVMANPKLEGFTKDKLPYKMTATRAIQDFGEMERVTLDGIKARVPINPNSTADIVAEKGVFDNKSNTLEITTPVFIETNDGMKAQLTDARVDIKTGSLKTDKPVEIDVRGNTIKADSMTVSEKGEVMVFENKVRMTLKPRDGAAGESAANAVRQE